MEDLSTFSAKPRLRLMLDRFSKIKDTRQAWKVAYPLCEVLFLVVCGTIANCDDYEDVVDWGNAHLSFLRGFAEFHYGIPCADWLRTVMNRIDPDLFMTCFFGSPNAGRTSSISWRSTARPHAAAIIERPATRPCTWCRPSPPITGWCWVRRRSMKNQMKSPPFQPSWSALILRALWSRLMLWGATPTLPSRSSTPRPITC